VRQALPLLIFFWMEALASRKKTTAAILAALQIPARANQPPLSLLS